ncbi:preQ(1) synthase [Desertimonas flava]|uniref:preQ(1) synthase n=1 Tax=Desertimonas flava TaxID=2064846 RepID=UPI001D0C8FA6|nr:preQ(1) synthase [Desertimonas flava]
MSESDLPEPSSTGEPPSLTILGSTVRHAVDHVEVFPAPAHVTEVRFSTDEVASVCPVTGQPDLSSVEISYVPAEWCVESKSLKLYLWRFRDQQVFAEALAAEIAGEIMLTAAPNRVTVRITQRPRGGITLTALAELP